MIDHTWMFVVSTTSEFGSLANPDAGSEVGTLACS